ncbi:hypothetical protein DFH07DRAFT_767379 [Mycena maculata]|uniref:Xylanolytic transcriptional activator regulatory domain-containing protein n=1 Tax=Mycena maculata TaxID=230809 RepID=A0AAD7NT78_9AGAR|nr:hypothetical protein DFH07DRAFT_767379 [Mycena maculata]
MGASPSDTRGPTANSSVSNSQSCERRRFGETSVGREELDDDNNVRTTNATYFMSGPPPNLRPRAQLIEQHGPPDILIHGIVGPTDVDKLFNIFYARINPFIALLDPVLHTPERTFAQFCAISSRYYLEKSEIYPIAMHFAKHSAANALTDGWKSIELCQAYILMSIYAAPVLKWEEDRSWLYAGLAIHLATDLSLHKPTRRKGHKMSEEHERELLNCTRVGMLCFNLDCSTGMQLGKPLTRIKGEYRADTQHHVDFRSVIITHEARLSRFNEEWTQRFAQDSDPNDPIAVLRCKLLPFLVAYSRLVMFSFGFQKAHRRGFQLPNDHIFFAKGLEAAKVVLFNMVECLAPTDFMCYAPDSLFMFSAFASAFLLRLLQPEFSQLMAYDQKKEVLTLIRRHIQTLTAPGIAIDDRRTPKIYARFLAKLLSSSLSEYEQQQSGLRSTSTISTLPATGTAFRLESADRYGGVFPEVGKVARSTYYPEEAYTWPIQYSAELELRTDQPGEEQMLAAMQTLPNSIGYGRERGVKDAQNT